VLAVVQAFALIGVVVAVGGVVGRTEVLGENARMVLNRTAFHVGVPALMLITLADATPAQVFSPPLMVAALTAITAFALYFALTAGILRRSRGEAAIGASAASVVNAGNLGLPLSTYVLGSTTEVSSIILFQYIVLVPLSLAILDSESAEARSVGHRLKALVTTPIIAASAVGMTLAAADVELPAALRDPLELLAALAIPTVLLAFGMSLTSRAERPPRPRTGDLLLALASKAVLMPMIAYALARWCFHADAEQIMVATVLAALPAAQNINTYAAVYRRAEGLARDATLISTVLSVPVIILVVALTN
jgi:predicted permease